MNAKENCTDIYLCTILKRITENYVVTILLLLLCNLTWANSKFKNSLPLECISDLEENYSKNTSFPESFTGFQSEQGNGFKLNNTKSGVISENYDPENLNSENMIASPANDDACNATNLNLDATSNGDDYTNVDATAQIDEPDQNLNNGVDGSVWFKFTAPITGDVRITTDILGGSLKDSEVAVYSVGDCSDFDTYTQIDFDQDEGVVVQPGFMSILDLTGLNSGQEYYIQVDRWNTADAGTFGIEVINLTYTYSLANGYEPSNPSGRILTGNNNDLIGGSLNVLDGTAVISESTFLQVITVYPDAVLDVLAKMEANILFKSNANGSGQLTNVTGETINGDITVERFIPVATEDTRAFRFLTSAVDSNGSIFVNWQEGGNSPAGFGTHITGDNSGTVGNFNTTTGIDYTFTGNPSMYTFDNTSADGDGNQGNDWEAVTDTKGNNLVAGQAYRIFIRGDRNYDLDSSGPDAPNSDVTLRATGSLVTSNKTETLSDVGGYYSMIGNPYQANVNINNVTGNNFNTNAYYIWDPNMSTRGAYVTVELPGGTTSGTSDANQFVQPGQSFFVQTLNNGAANLIFSETAKDVAALPTDVFSDNNQTSINLLLYTNQALNNNESESDALGINFNHNGNNAVDQLDAGKLGNPDENLARLNNGEYISIENRAMPVDGESLEIFTNGYSATNYTFIANVSNLPNDVDAFLVDNYSGNQTLLTDGANQISFIVDSSIPGSIAYDRFSIDFEIETFGINDNELADFKVYPNPVTEGKLTIISPQMASEDVELNLYNMTGQSLMRTEGTFESNGEMKLNLGSYQAGVYFMEVSNNSEITKERIIIK